MVTLIITTLLLIYVFAFTTARKWYDWAFITLLGTIAMVAHLIEIVRY